MVLTPRHPLLYWGGGQDPWRPCRPGVCPAPFVDSILIGGRALLIYLLQSKDQKGGKHSLTWPSPGRPRMEGPGKPRPACSGGTGGAHLPGHHRLRGSEEVAAQGHGGPDHGGVGFSVIGLYQRRNICLKVTGEITCADQHALHAATFVS